METDRLVLGRYRLPPSLEIGDELEIVIKGRVRRIEAEQIDVTGYTGTAARAFLEGAIFVEFSVLDVGVQ